ncbi:MAG TPA: PIN domain-containing protein [Phycisphaerae bacterium]|nr:PIN domain-containing protein [Phycisphaerae bacterium]
MIYVIRAIFLILVSIVALAYTAVVLNSVEANRNFFVYYVMIAAVVVAFAVFLMDVVVKKKNLSTMSGVLFGILVGVLISLCVGYLIDQITDVFILQRVTPQVEVEPAQGAEETLIPAPATSPTTAPEVRKPSWRDRAMKVRLTDPEVVFNETILTLMQGVKLLIGLMVTYITVSFILQTKDDFRFIIPYVEFSRATKGPRPMLLDTSVIIDGRIADMAATGLFESPIVVPRFVLLELQTIADSGDRLKRSRGRRGLEVLEKLKGMTKLELRFWDGTLTNVPEEEGGGGVDQKLVALAQQEGGRIVTNDFNLNKVASLRGVDVVNINLIADALKPVALPGESMKVRIVKPGEGPTQGVGYLEDGTMVVVEGARDKVGTEVELVVTNALQTAAGKMIFGRTDGGGHAPGGGRAAR